MMAQDWDEMAEQIPRINSFVSRRRKARTYMQKYDMYKHRKLLNDPRVSDSHLQQE